MLAVGLLTSVSGCKKKGEPEPSATPEVTATAEATEEPEKEAEETKEPEKTEEAEKKTEEKKTEKKETKKKDEKKSETKKETKKEEPDESEYDEPIDDVYIPSDYVPPQPEMETETTADLNVETIPVSGLEGSMTETTDSTAIITGQENTKETDEAGVADALKKAQEAAKKESEKW